MAKHRRNTSEIQHSWRNTGAANEANTLQRRSCTHFGQVRPTQHVAQTQVGKRCDECVDFLGWLSLCACDRFRRDAIKGLISVLPRLYVVLDTAIQPTTFWIKHVLSYRGDTHTHTLKPPQLHRHRTMKRTHPFLVTSW